MDRRPLTTRVYGGGGNGSDDDDDRFLDDSLLDAFRQEGLNNGYFSLGLVVNWPSVCAGASHQAYNPTNYEEFLSAVKTECFGGRYDFLFCVPFHALHITIATPYPAIRCFGPPPQTAEPTVGDGRIDHNKISHDRVEDDPFVGERELKRSAVVDGWKRILLRASSSYDWPKRPLELELESAQIGNRAGILLWKEHTGGIAKMRRCIEVAATEEESSSFSKVVQENLKIPDIIHTTFVRYQNCETLQKTAKIVNGGAAHDDVPLPLLRPSQAHSALIERVLPNQALFSKTREFGTENGADKHPQCETDNKCSTGELLDRVVADIATLVDCKIYLLDPRKEEGHEIFVSLPLKESTESDSYAHAKGF